MRETMEWLTRYDRRAVLKIGLGMRSVTCDVHSVLEKVLSKIH
jgi:putative salt-induced outer membrane protein YdiY